MLTGPKMVLAPFRSRCLANDAVREFSIGEVIVMQPYVWAGEKDEAFTFEDVNYGAPAAVLEECTAVPARTSCKQDLL
jgi:hypothetical protein